MNRDGIIDEMREEAEIEGKTFVEPKFQEAGVEEAYDHIIETLKKSRNLEKDISYNNLFEDFIHEKSFNLNRFTVKDKTE